MSRIAYLNGRYVPHATACVHIEDRGYQFSDGVYEVCLLLNGRLLDLEPHLARLERSLNELRIARPMGDAALKAAMRQLIAKNRVREGTLYLQITRGVARRDHPFPVPEPDPALVMTVRRFNVEAFLARQRAGVAVKTVPDLRWKRCDIKSVSLLGNVLAKQAAREAGAAEAWMLDEDGRITEGSSTTAWIVTGKDELVTRALGPEILPGITRQVIVEIAAREGLTLVERPFDVAEAQKAREAFFASTTSFVTPVAEIDGQVIANGAPGALTRSLIAAHWTHVRAETGFSPEGLED